MTNHLGQSRGGLFNWFILLLRCSSCDVNVCGGVKYVGTDVGTQLFLRDCPALNCTLSEKR